MRDLYQRRCRAGIAEHFLADFPDRGLVTDIHEEKRDLDDVLEAAAFLLQEGLHAFDDMAGLRLDIAYADWTPLDIPRHRAGDKKKISGTYRKRGWAAKPGRIGDFGTGDFVNRHPLSLQPSAGTAC